MKTALCPTCGSDDYLREGDRCRCDCGATWFTRRPALPPNKRHRDRKNDFRRNPKHKEPPCSDY